MGIIGEIKERVHGVISLSLICIAIIIGFSTILVENATSALIYLTIIFVAPFVICYFYCLKCPCRIGNCGHVFPGKLTRIFNPKNSTAYNFMDYFAVVFFLGLLIGFPQYWLFQNILLFILFWSIVIVALIEVRLFVCKKCRNIYCPAITKKKGQQA